MHYIVGLARNARLQAQVTFAELWMKDDYERTGAKQRLIDEFDYAAQSWPHERRVITRLEWGEQGCNPRFVVTNLAGEPQNLYDKLYCQRGEAENRTDTVPPSIVLIVLGSVAGLSIAGLFQAGFVVAMVLLFTLVAVARWKARNEDTSIVRRTPWKTIGRLFLIASPALALPFVIRSAVGEGVATATEVSTIAVLYSLIVGHFLYGGIKLNRLYGMLVETAALSGAVLMILGTAAAMAWSITQSGVVHTLSNFLTTLPGGAIAFMAVSIVVFVVLGCLLEGLPAILLLAPIMFPIAKKLGIHDIQYAMVVVASMNIGLMLPPVGVGFYVACRIGEGKPDEVMRAIWPYIAALLAGVVAIASIPAISTIAL